MGVTVLATVPGCTLGVSARLPAAECGFVNMSGRDTMRPHVGADGKRCRACISAPLYRTSTADPTSSINSTGKNWDSSVAVKHDSSNAVRPRGCRSRWEGTAVKWGLPHLRPGLMCVYAAQRQYRPASYWPMKVLECLSPIMSQSLRSCV